MSTVKPRLDLNSLLKGIINGDRIVLGQAITLMESNLAKDQQRASDLLEKILPYTGNSIRIGVTGIPGVGKSTFIEAIGSHIIGNERKIAVLSVDPTSPLSKGSILGDKTRMDTLSKNSFAFVRPTAASDALGGVAARTRECMLLCEAAGYNVIIIETVGVGQSEVAVSNMVDFFVLLMIGGAGDELQGMKKGIIELADAIVITKADGVNFDQAMKTKDIYKQALRLLASTRAEQPQVMTCSAYTGEGIASVWDMVQKLKERAVATERLDQNRRAQNVHWFKDQFNGLLLAQLRNNTSLQAFESSLESAVIQNKISPRAAARELFSKYVIELHANK